MKGTVLNVTRFCTDDGPGIRTTVFLKGCPLRCLWCHNPESQSKQPEIMYDAKKCFACARCADVCTMGCHSVNSVHVFNRTGCIGCGACAEICTAKALELYGKRMSVDEVFAEIKKDKTFYEISGGGITVSGGEPLFQPEFTAELLKICKANGIHTAIETGGFADESKLLSVIKYCDLVLFDIKETDEELHKLYTGVSFKPIFKSLTVINEHKIPFMIRAPIIPTLNDRELHLEALKAFRSSMEFCQGVQIMPYHKIGTYKYELLGRSYSCREINEPGSETVSYWKKLI